MPKHFEQAPGLYEETVPETEGYVFNQTMMRIKEPERSMDFYTRVMGMRLVRKLDFPEMKFTLYFLGYLDDRQAGLVPQDDAHRTTYTFGREAMLELTHNWDQEEPYTGGRNFGHLAYSVENIYDTCQRLQDMGVTILRPPRDGRMAFVRSPDQISIELLQDGEALEIQEPWASMPSQGEW